MKTERADFVLRLTWDGAPVPVEEQREECPKGVTALLGKNTVSSNRVQLGGLGQVHPEVNFLSKEKIENTTF